jgi:chitinase
VRALLMLGGAGAGANIAKAAAPSARAAFVSRLLAALDTLGYDGLDLDWEDSVDLDNLVALAADLRKARPTIVLSYPAGTINPNFMSVDPRYVELAKSLDRFNVQTYYPSTALAGGGWKSWFNSPVSGWSPSTPITIDDSLQRYATAGIPKSKLGFGVGFYAICYTNGITAPRQDTASAAITGGDNIFPLSAFFATGSIFDKSSATERKLDTAAQVPYLSLGSAVTDPHCGNRATRYISYDDETSLKAKGTFSKTNGYGGIIIWTIQEGWLPANAAGGRARNSLMLALKQGFLDR